MSARTSTTAGVSGTMRGPDLESRMRSSPAVRSTSSQRSAAISPWRQPVNISSRIAAAARGQAADPFPSASSSTRPSRRNSSGVRNCSRLRSPVLAYRPARVRAGRYKAPCLGQREHLGQKLDHLVCHIWRVAKLIVKARHLRPVHCAQGHSTQRRQDVLVQHLPVQHRCGRLAVHRHMGAHAAFGQFGNGEFGRRRYRHRILAPLDAIDDERGLLPRLVGRHFAMAADGNALRSVRPAALHDIDFPSGGIDPHPEARERGPGPRRRCPCPRR